MTQDENGSIGIETHAEEIGFLGLRSSLCSCLWRDSGMAKFHDGATRTRHAAITIAIARGRQEQRSYCGERDEFGGECEYARERRRLERRS
jgi:hypothetical protein